MLKFQFCYQFQKNFHWKLFHIFKWAKSLYPAKRKGFAEAKPWFSGDASTWFSGDASQAWQATGHKQSVWGHKPAFVQGTANGSTLQAVGE